MIALAHRLASEAFYLLAVGFVRAADHAGQLADAFDTHVSRETSLPLEDQ